MAKRKTKKNKKLINWYLVSIFIVVLVLLAYIIYKSEKIEEARFTRYPAFGIDLPDNYDIHGIDVSHHQSYIDWRSVKKMQVDGVKLSFAFIKATEGLKRVDKQFKRNWRKAKEAGIIRGAYHFFIPGKSGKLQAENFIASVKLQPGDLPPVLDIEQLYGTRPATMRKQIKEWLTLVEDYYNVKPIIYTYVNFYTHHLAEEFNDYPLWAAHYAERNTPRIERPWIFWQHSERGRVNGIVSRVDFNVFNGDDDDFADLLKK